MEGCFRVFEISLLAITVYLLSVDLSLFPFYFYSLYLFFYLRSFSTPLIFFIALFRLLSLLSTHLSIISLRTSSFSYLFSNTQFIKLISAHRSTRGRRIHEYIYNKVCFNVYLLIMYREDCYLNFVWLFKL